MSSSRIPSWVAQTKAEGCKDVTWSSAAEDGLALQSSEGCTSSADGTMQMSPALQSAGPELHRGLM
jgi:hypothetical protein